MSPQWPPPSDSQPDVSPWSPVGAPHTRTTVLNSGTCHSSQSSFRVYRALHVITSTGPLFIFWFKVVTNK